MARGLKTTQALVIIARKLARIAFSLMKNLSEYQSKRFGGFPKTIELPQWECSFLWERACSRWR
ncbi:hypothetical protein F0170_12265 [Pseudomonas sp. MAFF 730085]|uniref:IS110 family transposase n=1 Tax=Pseudomonas kitaguniensis TaxID=2607908 RepID=A0A5N7JTG3_9PSED|nr:hypothetical protein [Pseudomonas kitaguniensis]